MRESWQRGLRIVRPTGVRTLLASLAIHGVGAVILASIDDSTPPAAPPAPIDLTLIEVSPAVAVPLPVAVPVPVAGPVAAAVAGPVAVKSEIASLSTQHRVASSVSPPTPPPHPTDTAPDGILSMRGAHDHALPRVALFGGRAWRTDGAFPATDDPGLPGLTDPGPPEPRGKPAMVPHGNGTYVRKHPGYTAHVARDGRLSFQDKNWSGHFVMLYHTHIPLMYVAIFDITDTLMRMHHIDPYSYDKLKFLEDTQDERMEMAAAERTDNLRAALLGLPAYLGSIWKESTLSPAARRKIIFDLWDECAEEGDEELIAASKTARATIIAFVRRALPARSTDAYPADELATLNAARTSHEAFVPYDTP